MANMMGRDLVKGEIIVFDKVDMSEDYQDLSKRVAIVTGGFGMSQQGMGRGLFVEFLDDGEKCLMKARISKKETEELEALYMIIGWFKDE